MNYLTLINQFWTLRKEVPFSSTEADLYFYLLNVSNGLKWKNPFQQANPLIGATLGISEKPLIAARNRLKQYGLIDFAPGVKRSPSTYTLLLLPGMVPDTPGNTLPNALENIQPISNTENTLENIQGIREECGSECGSESGSESGSVSGEKAPAINKPKGEVNETKKNETSGPPLAAAAEKASPAEHPNDGHLNEKKTGRKKKGAARTVRTNKPEVAFADSELGTLEAFSAAFADTDYALANLPYYFQKVLNWRQNGEAPTRKDWKATAARFFLNDIESNSLVLAPGTRRHPADGHDPADAGARAGGYRSNNFD